MADASQNPVLDDRWLKRAAWWVNHRDQLRRLAIGATVVVEAALIAYSAYGWVDYLVLGRSREERLYAGLARSVDATPIHDAFAPKPLGVASPVVLPGSRAADGRSDVLVKLSNQNPAWTATVRYAFSSAPDVDRQTFILNDEERFIIGAGVASGSGASPTFVLKQVAWHRLREPQKFNALKPKFVVSDVDFAPARAADRGAPAVSRVRYTAANESAQSFWSVGFTVVLLQGDRPVAAQFTTLEQLRSGEQRTVSLNLYTIIPAVTRVLVVPEVNVGDPGVFMPVAGPPITF